ncbi:MAG: alpha/beta hydrolase [Amaricoccus sp.]|uniref:alpha/beta hydrolase n=1 Tax=Amaricoccus sp. TaxID=1872485 RepID=UPI003315F13E
MTEPAPFFAEVADAPDGACVAWLTAPDGVRLRAATWAGGARGTAILFPGRTEYIEKYGQVIGRLVERGFSVAVVDWRGQGLSDRLAANPMLGHVEDFRDYQRDVAALLGWEAVATLPRPFHLVCHSMGGCVGLRSMLERADFASAIFSAPMWHLRMRMATREITARATKFALMMGLGARLMPGASARPTPLVNGFEGNALTSDPEQFARSVRQITAHPDLSLGGPSMQWTRAALEEMARLYIAPVPRLPVLALVGSEETVVSTSVIRRQVAAMADGAFATLAGARHEIFMENPTVQTELWARIDGFLAEVESSAPRRAAN